MSASHNFTYRDARSAFASRISDAQHIPYTHPELGPDGEIAMDVAFWEGKNTDDILVVSSGTHGVEGYCGSFIQCALLDEHLPARIAEHCSLMMIHGVNPYGFAWQRRVNENNVDLNRNFIDHTALHRANPGYRELAHIVEPELWTEDTSNEVRSALLNLIGQHPEDPRWLQAALSGGQYEYPNGQFYGGINPQWSNVHIRNIVESQLSGRNVVWIDVHTALGEYGTGQCIVELDPGSAMLHRAESLWGDRVGNMGTADSVSVAVAGSMITGMEKHLDSKMLGTGLEFGTVDSLEVVLALIQDQWLHHFGQLDSALGIQTKARMMNAFYPDDDAWRTSVLDIARDVVNAVIEHGFA